MGLTKAAISRPIFILMIMVAAVLLGYLSYNGMRKEESPDVSFGVVTISTAYPGASPEEVNTLISRKIEDSISGVNGLRQVTSTSQEGISVVVAQFDIGTNMDSALSDIRTQVDATVGSLPTDALKPVVNKIDTTSTPVMTLALSNPNLSNEQLRDLADNKISDMFGQISGVASVYVNGGAVREIQVQLNRDKLLAYHLGIAQIQQAVVAATGNIPSGHIVSGPQDTNVKVVGEFQSVDQLRNMILSIPNFTSFNGTPTTVKLSDVANVVDATAERDTYTRLNGQESVSITIDMSRDGNAIEISKAADQVIAQVKQLYGVNILKTSEESTQIQDSLSDLSFSLFFGILLVATIVFVFLHNLRGTLIVSIAIPVCLMASFIAMVALGFTVNSMSMLALSLAIGVLVDDAIVVLENIYRHLRLGEDPREAAINGRSEIGLAAIAITMADVVVFTPIGFMGGILGEFFKPLGLTYAAVVLISLFVSFTVTPMLASRWYRAGEDLEHPTGVFARTFERGFHGLERFYKNVLEWALNHRWFVFVLGFSILISVFMIIAGGGAPNPKAAIQTGMGLTFTVIEIGFVAFGINYWSRAMAPRVRRWFIWASVVLAVFLAAGMSSIPAMAMMKAFLPAPIVGIMLFVMGLFMVWLVYGVAGFIANIFKTRFKSRFVLSAVAFGLMFPAACLVGFAWQQYKGEALFNFAFMPPQDNSSVSIGVELAPNASLSATQAVVSRIEKICMADPDVKYTLSQVGAASGGGFGGNGALGENRASIQLTLYDKASFTDHFHSTKEHLRSRSDTTVAADLLERIGKIPGANITVSANQGGFGLPIQFSVVGENYGQLVQTANDIVAQLRSGVIKGIVNPDLSSKPGVPEDDIIPDRRKLAQDNLTVADLGNAARIMYQGDNTAKYRVNGEEYDIRTMLSYQDRNNPNILNELPISFFAGNPIYMSDVAKITAGTGVDVIQRINRQDQVQITADLLPGYSAGNVQAQIDQWMKDKHMLPQGVKEVAGGQADIQAREGGNLFLAMFIGLILVYMVLASLYDNLLYPFVIQLAQPQAMVGALLALMILNQPLNIVGMIGIITLIGLVGKNAILVVDYTNTLRDRGRNRHDALLEAGPTRLRPILMTTSALILGILPVALAIGRGSEFRQTIGTTIIGGMLLSTVLTLVVIPCSYTIMDDFSLYVGRVLRKGGKGKPGDELPQETEPEAAKVPAAV